MTPFATTVEPMPGEPRVDVLLPVKNGATFLEETLAGLERQEGCHVRVLAWDNGSTDGSVELLSRWIPHRLPGVVVADRPLPLGSSLARLVELAETELIARIDDDDVPTPDRLALQASALNGDRRLVAVCGFGVTTDATGTEVRRYAIPTDDLSLQWMLLFTNPFLHSNMMLRRSTVLAAGNYRDCMPVEDYDLWMRMAPLGAFGVVDRNTLQHRLHDRSVCAATRDTWSTLVPDVQRRYWPTLLPGMGPEELAFLTAASRWIHAERPTGAPGFSGARLTDIVRRYARVRRVSPREVVASPGFRYTRRKLFPRGLTARAWRFAWGLMAIGAGRRAGGPRGSPGGVR